MSNQYYDRALKMGEASFILKDVTLIPVANYKDLKTAFIYDSIS